MFKLTRQLPQYMEDEDDDDDYDDDNDYDDDEEEEEDGGDGGVTLYSRAEFCRCRSTAHE